MPPNCCSIDSASRPGDGLQRDEGLQARVGQRARHGIALPGQRLHRDRAERMAAQPDGVAAHARPGRLRRWRRASSSSTKRTSATRASSCSGAGGGAQRRQAAAQQLAVAARMLQVHHGQPGVGPGLAPGVGTFAAAAQAMRVQHQRARHVPGGPANAQRQVAVARGVAPAEVADRHAALGAHAAGREQAQQQRTPLHARAAWIRVVPVDGAFTRHRRNRAAAAAAARPLKPARAAASRASRPGR